MKTKDIKPGVIYGYRRGKTGPIQPIVFLAEPGPDHVYVYDRFAHGDTKIYGRTSRKPGRGQGFDSDAGWPAVTIHPVDGAPGALLAVTLSDFLNATERYRTKLDAQFMLVTNPGHVLGTYEQALSRQQAESEGRDAAAKRRLGSWERLEAAKTGLASHGITGERLGSDALTLDVDQAEKLLGRLDKVTDAWADPFGQWTAEQADAARQMKAHILRILTEEAP